MKSLSKNILNRIKSKYILIQVFEYLKTNSKLKLIQFNKNLQSKLNIHNYSYIFNNIYTKLDEGKNINLKYNKNDNSIINIIEKYISRKSEKRKILKNFFKDLYNNYYKDFIIINYYAEFFSEDNFNFLLSLNAPIKINIKFNIKNWYYAKVERNEKRPILNIFNYNKSIYGIDFELKLYLKTINYNIFDLFLNKINQKFVNLEYVKIPCDLLNILIGKNKRLFFQNKFKTFEIYDYEKESFILFIDSFYKIKKLLKAENLKIHFHHYQSKFDEILDLTEMKSIKNIEIKDESSFCSVFEIILNKKTTENLNNLSLETANFRFEEEENIKFPNLTSLKISRIYLDRIFSFNNSNDFNFNLFPKLENLTIEIRSLIDYFILDNILKYTDNLLELNISEDIYNPYRDMETDSEFKKYFENYGYFNDGINSVASIEEIDVKNEFNRKSQILGNTILNLKSLKYLRINNFDNDCKMIDIILNNYKSNNLIEFQSNCIGLSSAKNFINNNKGLIKIKLDYFYSN